MSKADKTGTKAARYVKPGLSTGSLLAAAFLFLLVQLSGQVVLHGQQMAPNVGGIRGVVRDPSGAVIPGASVAARAVATGVEIELKSNTEGAYAFPSLAIGEYEITVRAAGFNTLKRPGVRVVSSETVTFDLTLEVGATAQTVEVSAQPAAIDATTTTAGTTRVTEEISELPLLNQAANRSVISYIRSFAGVIPTTSYADGTPVQTSN
jgi:Carboxypeptidase regulatory-like domain